MGTHLVTIVIRDEASNASVCEKVVSFGRFQSGQQSSLAENDQFSTVADTALVLSDINSQFSDLLVNDSDVDGDTLSLIDVFNPVGGAVSYDYQTGEVVFTPNPGFLAMPRSSIGFRIMEAWRQPLSPSRFAAIVLLLLTQTFTASSKMLA